MSSSSLYIVCRFQPFLSRPVRTTITTTTTTTTRQQLQHRSTTTPTTFDIQQRTSCNLLYNNVKSQTRKQNYHHQQQYHYLSTSTMTLMKTKTTYHPQQFSMYGNHYNHVMSGSCSFHRTGYLWKQPMMNLRLLSMKIPPATPSHTNTTFRRFFSQQPPILSENVEKTKRWMKSRWHYVASFVRYVRIPFLVVSVYSIGYQQGIIDCTKSPGALQLQMLKSILLQEGITDPDDIHVVNEADISMFSPYTEKHYRIAAVGQRIINSARDYVDDEFTKVIQTESDKLSINNSSKGVEENIGLLETNENVQYWIHARLRLKGEDLPLKPWKYVILNSKIPNAFVSEVLPQHFFITTAMLELASTPDELGFVLGHEISHLILGHLSQANQFEMFLRTFEILLLSIDPTAGVLSLTFISLIWGIRRMISAANSREREYEADQLGLVLAAQACFDTIAGVDVLHKMFKVSQGQSLTDINKEMQSNNSILFRKPKKNNDEEKDTSSKNNKNKTVGIFDSHPPTLERYEKMKLAAMAGENCTKYSDKQCASSIRKLLWK